MLLELLDTAQSFDSFFVDNKTVDDMLEIDEDQDALAIENDDALLSPGCRLISLQFCCSSNILMTPQCL